MILLDSDILLIAHRYQQDARFPVNDQALRELRSTAVPLGITVQALLEVVGILSFNVPAGSVARLPHLLVGLYGLLIYCRIFNRSLSMPVARLPNSLPR